MARQLQEIELEGEGITPRDIYRRIQLDPLTFDDWPRHVDLFPNSAA